MWKDSKLGVDTALQYCPLIPSCEKVEKSDRQFNRRIYEPFEKTLRDLGFNYEFLLNGVVKNADDIHGMSCTQYLKMSVSFSIPDIIIDVERLTRRKEEKAKAKQRKEKNNIWSLPQNSTFATAILYDCLRKNIPFPPQWVFLKNWKALSLLGFLDVVFWGSFSRLLKL